MVVLFLDVLIEKLDIFEGLSGFGGFAPPVRICIELLCVRLALVKDDVLFPDEVVWLLEVIGLLEVQELLIQYILSAVYSDLFHFFLPKMLGDNGLQHDQNYHQDYRG